MDATIDVDNYKLNVRVERVICIKTKFWFIKILFLTTMN